MLKLSDFDYHLPKELIAQYPVEDREKARLLVVDRKTGLIEHKVFSDIRDYFSPGDLLILNDTRVLPCRLIGKRKTGGRVEVLLLEQAGQGVFNALIRPAKIRVLETIFFADGITCEVSARNQVSFSTGDLSKIYGLGTVPLPPYIKRETRSADNQDYQTVYAKKDGSIASPTAGLHFTQGLLDEISSRADIAYITLHISYSTFKPVKVDDVFEHKMDLEYYSIGRDVLGLIEEKRKNKNKIFSVGTTTTRALESYARGKEGATDLFIYPGFEFKVVDHLITNFHLPRTTLFMLACAFAGTELLKKAYLEAVEKKYRFYSYGDAMLIL